MTYTAGSGDMQIYDSLPLIVRRALAEAISPPATADVAAALRATRDPHGVAGRIRAIDARIRAGQEIEIDELTMERST